jgi:uncharacterized protein (DUF2147 family)
MKSILLVTAGFAVAFCPASAFAHSALQGNWKKGAMEIVIGPCGPTLCGKVIHASAKQQSKAQHGSGAQLLGAKVIDNIEPSGPKTWKASVFVPSRNIYAKGTIEEVGPDQLTVRACAVICKTTEWNRTSDDTDEGTPN